MHATLFPPKATLLPVQLLLCSFTLDPDLTLSSTMQHSCIHTGTNTHIHTPLCSHSRPRYCCTMQHFLHSHRHKHTHTYTSAPTQGHAFIQAHTHTHTNTHTSAPTHGHAFIQAHTHEHTPLLPPKATLLLLLASGWSTGPRALSNSCTEPLELAPARLRMVW